MLRQDAVRDATEDSARLLQWSLAVDTLECADITTARATDFRVANALPQWNSAALTEALKRTQP